MGLEGSSRPDDQPDLRSCLPGPGEPAFNGWARSALRHTQVHRWASAPLRRHNRRRFQMPRNVIRLDAGMGTEDEALRVAEQVHDEALRVAEEAANTERARAEAIRAATVARAAGLRRVSGQHNDALRAAEAARAAALRNVETRYGEALAGAEQKAT